MNVGQLILTMMAASLALSCSGPGMSIIDIDHTGDGPPSAPIDVAMLVDPVPTQEPPSKYGNPEQYTALGIQYRTMDSSEGYSEKGVASWYGQKFAGRRTSSGEPFDPYQLTAAHARLPIPSYAEVVNLDNGKRTVVRINDRGPFSKHRLIDLSYAAAVKLGIDKAGTGRVRVTALTAPASEPIAVQATTDNRVGNMPGISDGGPSYFVQIGAFSEETNAARLAETLQSAYGSVRVETSTSGARRLYKVQVGPYTTEQRAQQAAERLTRDGHPVRLVSNETELP